MITLLIRHQSAVKITRVSTTYLTYQAKTMATDARPKVFVTRRVPARGIDLLKDKFVVSQWDREDRIPPEELLRGVKGVDALFCLLTDKIDKDVLDEAGMCEFISKASKKNIARNSGKLTRKQYSVKITNFHKHNI